MPAKANPTEPPEIDANLARNQMAIDRNFDFYNKFCSKHGLTPYSPSSERAASERKKSERAASERKKDEIKARRVELKERRQSFWRKELESNKARQNGDRDQETARQKELKIQRDKRRNELQKDILEKTGKRLTLRTVSYLISAKFTSADQIREALVTTDRRNILGKMGIGKGTLAQLELAFGLKADKHETSLPIGMFRRSFVINHHCGDLFDDDVEYDGLALSIEIKSRAEADAVLAAIRNAITASKEDKAQ